MGGCGGRRYREGMPLHYVLLLLGFALGGWASRGRPFRRD